MKRILIVLLAALLLSGCAPLPGAGNSEPAQNQGSTGPGLKETLLAGGAVRRFDLPAGEYLGCIPVDKEVLLFSKEGENTRIRLISAESGETQAETVLNCILQPDPNKIRITQRNLAYYDKRDNSAVLLNAELSEVMRLSMPDDIQGTPLWSAELDEIFYCTKSEIRSLSVKNLVPRLLRSQTVSWQEMMASGIGGKVLAYSAVSEHGTPYVAFLESDTGTVLGTDEALKSLTVSGDLCYLERAGGADTEILVGTYGSSLKSLTTENEMEKSVPALAMKSIVTSREDTGNTILNLYSIETGKLYASVTMENMTGVFGLCASEEQILFLHQDESGHPSLCAWNVNSSQIQNEKVYTKDWTVKLDPEDPRVKRCAGIAERIFEISGVKVWMGEDAISKAGIDGAQPEHRIDALEEALQVLLKILSRYPEGFLKKTGEATESGAIQICLVRNLDDYQDGVQFWNGKNAYIVLETTEQLEPALYRGMNRLIDSYVIANSKTYDTWNSLNPEGFSYSPSYADAKPEETEEYLEGENRAFINAVSMTYPREDREHIMQYAMTAGNSELFQAPYLQSKLAAMCKAIREAYDMKEAAEAFPWEQYLQKTESSDEAS